MSINSIVELDALYASEINVSFQSFYDTGIEWKLGDDLNGVTDSGTEYGYAKAAKAACEAALARFPDSDYAKGFVERNALSAQQQDESRPVQIRESGLLWLINKSLMHPRGYALGYDDETKEFSLLGDGEESWQFMTKREDPEFGIDEDALLAKIKQLLP